MDSKNYVSLHSHSDFSRLDSVAKIKDLVNKAKSLEMPAIALTDHGTISGWISFYKHCSDAGIKPIFGLEAYIVEDAHAIKNIEIEIETTEEKEKNNLPLFDGILEGSAERIEELKAMKGKERKSNHVILLAKNEEGYRNIIKLSSWGYINGYYYKPRVDLKILEENKAGIITTSACLGGQISYNIIKGNLEKAEWFVKEYKRIFGRDFYIEIQLHPVDIQAVVNKQLIMFAKKHDIPMIITQDVHYVEAEDVELHEVVIKLKNKEKDISLVKEGDVPREIDIQREVSKTRNKRTAFMKESVMRLGLEKESLDADGYFYNAREYYFKTFDEIKDTWQKYHNYISEKDFDDAIGNTIKIASTVEKINAYSQVAYLPKVVEGEVSAIDMFKKIVKEGAKTKLGPKIKDNPELKNIYEKRLKEEMDIIFDLGFEDYLLIVWDYIHWANENDIMVGPGRGSCAGSLVAYCADITKVDPITHGLLFSRFINKSRSSAKYKLEFDQVALEKK